MKNTIIRSAAIIATSAFVLAGCGAVTDEEKPVAAPVIEEEAPAEEAAAAEAPAIEEETEEQEPAGTAVEQGGPGVCQAVLMSGAVACTDAGDLAQARKRAGVAPVGHHSIGVDTTNGTAEALVVEAEIVDSEGKTYTYEEVTSSTYDWADTNYDLIYRQLELWDK